MPIPARRASRAIAGCAPLHTSALLLYLERPDLPGSQRQSLTFALDPSA
ncbi:hypothetical protein ACFQVB_33545 [Paraburkholderia humisilvae]